MERRGIILTGMTRVDIVPVTDQRLTEAEVTSLRSLVKWGGSRAHGVLFHVTGFITMIIGVSLNSYQVSYYQVILFTLTPSTE